jgi:hypothetical protein
MFIIFDKKTKEIFTSENHKKLDIAGEESGFHPSYRFWWLLDEEGLLQIENVVENLEVRETGFSLYVLFLTWMIVR